MGGDLGTGLEHGWVGVVGVLSVAILLLLRMLKIRNNSSGSPLLKFPLEKLVTKELCMERHVSLEKRMDRMEVGLAEIMKEIRDLPRKINGRRT